MIQASVIVITVSFSVNSQQGGTWSYSTQNDNVTIELTFGNTNNQLKSNTTSLESMFVTDRESQSSLIYQQTNGLRVNKHILLLCEESEV